MEDCTLLEDAWVEGVIMWVGWTGGAHELGGVLKLWKLE